MFSYGFYLYCRAISFGLDGKALGAILLGLKHEDRFFVTKKSPAFDVVLAIARLTKAVITGCDNDRLLVFTDDHYQKSVIVWMPTRSAAQVLASRRRVYIALRRPFRFRPWARGVHRSDGLRCDVPESLPGRRRQHAIRAIQL